MFEKENIEFKLVWKDECLKSICGIANSHGGVLYLGINDKGQIIGIENAKKLLKELPNKIKNAWGISSLKFKNIISRDGSNKKGYWIINK